MASTFVVRGECKICLEDRLELDSFRVFPCGHCLCKKCLHDLFAYGERRKADCPFCRKKCLRTDASKLVFHPVVVDPVKESVDHVIEGLNRMDKNCQTVSVQRAHAKLTKAAEDARGDNVERLRKAIEDFAQRIVPLFEEVESGRKRIQELEGTQESKLRKLTAKARKVDSLQNEADSLRKSKEELECNYMEALDSADALRLKAEGLQSSLIGVRESLTAKEVEHRRAVDSLNRFKASDTLKSKKLKDLKQEIDELKAKLVDKEKTAEDDVYMMDVDQEWAPGTPAPERTRLPANLPAVYRHSPEEGWVTTNNFQFEGVPEPGFKPGWNFPNNANKKANVLLKKSKRSADFKSPLSLDNKGRPTVPVQIGPKTLIRTVQRF